MSIKNESVEDSAISSRCTACGCESVGVLIDLGKQPTTNRFNMSPSGNEGMFKLSLGQCNKCGIVQLVDKIPSKELKLMHDWIKYNEPEAHLDDFSVHILKHMPPKSKILGLSYKDSSLMERLKKYGHTGTILDVKEHLGIDVGGTEVIQEKLSGSVLKILDDIGKSDVIIARHIAEHFFDFQGFVDSMKKLLDDDGLLIVEVPDFRKSMLERDYSAIWEEHILYFTEDTFKNTMKDAGFDTAFFHNYMAVSENSISAVLRKRDIKKNVHEAPLEGLSVSWLNDALELGRKYSEDFRILKSRIQSFFRYEHGFHKKIAVFGAGHLGIAFVNYFGVSGYVSAFVDGNENKRGLYIPGMKIKIMPPEELENFDIILFGINPQGEARFLQNNKGFFCKKTELYSIFSKSPNRLPIYDEAPDLGLVKKSEEVYFYENDPDVAVFYRRHIGFLKSNIIFSKTKRIRICAHRNPQDSLHEMMILLDSDGYLAPHKHRNKIESFHVLEGELDVILFDDFGKITQRISLGHSNDSHGPYYRLNSEIFHMVMPKAPGVMIHETTNGPFIRENMVFADWAPDDKQDQNKINDYIEKIRNT